MLDGGVSPSLWRRAVELLCKRFGVSQRGACEIVKQHLSTQRYKSAARLPDRDLRSALLSPLRRRSAKSSTAMRPGSRATKAITNSIMRPARPRRGLLVSVRVASGGSTSAIARLPCASHCDPSPAVRFCRRFCRHSDKSPTTMKMGSRAQPTTKSIMRLARPRRGLLVSVCVASGVSASAIAYESNCGGGPCATPPRLGPGVGGVGRTRGFVSQEIVVLGLTQARARAPIE